MLKELSTQSPIFSEISFRNEQEIKTFSDRGKLGEFVTSRHTLKELLRSSLNRKEMIKKKKGTVKHQEGRKKHVI